MFFRVCVMPAWTSVLHPPPLALPLLVPNSKMAQAVLRLHTIVAKAVNCIHTAKLQRKPVGAYDIIAAV